MDAILFKSRTPPFSMRWLLWNCKNTLLKLKIFFSRTIGSISSKLGTKHSWVMESQVCSNEGSRHFPSGDNYEIAKLPWQIFKIYFISRTTGPISTKLGTNYPWVKGIQVCLNEEPLWFWGRIISKSQKSFTKFSKYFPP